MCYETREPVFFMYCEKLDSSTGLSVGALFIRSDHTTSTFNELYPFIFYRHYTMAEYAFFLQKMDWWRKDMAVLWEDLSICPLLHWFQLPCHSQV